MVNYTNSGNDYVAIDNNLSTSIDISKITGYVGLQTVNSVTMYGGNDTVSGSQVNDRILGGRGII